MNICPKCGKLKIDSMSSGSPSAITGNFCFCGKEIIKQKGTPLNEVCSIPRKWIFDSLDIIHVKNDATIAGGFTGAVINLLGRYLLHPNEISNNNKKPFINNQLCFYEFIEKYLKKYNQNYSKYKDLLWYFMRCESAHSVLARNAVKFGGDEKDREAHLEFHFVPNSNDKILFVHLKLFIEDLELAVKNFYNDLDIDISLQKRHRQVLSMMHQDAQEYIKKKYPKIQTFRPII